MHTRYIHHHAWGSRRWQGLRLAVGMVTDQAPSYKHVHKDSNTKTLLHKKPVYTNSPPTSGLIWHHTLSKQILTENPRCWLDSQHRYGNLLLKSIPLWLAGGKFISSKCLADSSKSGIGASVRWRKKDISEKCREGKVRCVSLEIHYWDSLQVYDCADSQTYLIRPLPGRPSGSMKARDTCITRSL